MTDELEDEVVEVEVFVAGPVDSIGLRRWLDGVRQPADADDAEPVEVLP
jgi:hypothetical protein